MKKGAVSKGWDAIEILPHPPDYPGAGTTQTGMMLIPFFNTTGPWFELGVTGLVVRAMINCVTNLDESNVNYHSPFLEKFIHNICLREYSMI